MVTIRDATEDDRAWVLANSDPIGGPQVVAGGMLYRLMDHPAIIATEGDTRLGFVVYRTGSVRWEILGILATDEGRGVGSKLLSEVEDRARASGAQQLRISTTNDNFASLGFTQKRGYTMRQLIPGAMTEAKRLKGLPADEPIFGPNGIEVRDEIVLNKNL